MRPVLLAQIEPPQASLAGDYFYRTHVPGLAMAQEDGVYVVNLTAQHRLREEVAAQADVLILKGICDPDYLPCIRNRKQEGRPTFYEIADDLTAVPEWNPVHFFYQDVENQRLFQRIARACRGLQFTCGRLEEIFGHLNPRCRVFPNQILELPAERAFKSKKRIVIGWGGSHGHLKDVAEIAGDLISWIRSRPETVLHLMCSEPIWQLFETLPARQKKHTNPGSIDDYYRFLSEIDVGLIPLQETGFNCSRSDIKFLEYAAAGVAAVVRKLTPYAESVREGENALTFENPGQMIGCLEALGGDWGLVEKLARAARDYVARSRMQKDHTGERLEFYSSDSGPAVSSDGAEARFGRLSQCDNATVQGRHLQLQAGRFELLLHDGLVTMQVGNDYAGARRCFQEAEGLEPANYLPYLFGARVAADPVSHLRKALQLKPDSVKSWILLGEEYARAGKIMESVQAFDAAAKLYPEYEIPYLRAGRLLEQIGQMEQARKLYGMVSDSIAKLEGPAPS